MDQTKTILGTRTAKRPALGPSNDRTLPQAMACPVAQAGGLNDAKVAPEARKARGAAFGPSGVGTLPRAMVRPPAQAWALNVAERP
jgi:hypothetical protein